MHPLPIEWAAVAPAGAFKTKDEEWVYLSGYSRQMLDMFLDKVGRRDLFEDPKFSTSIERNKHRKEFYEECVKIYASKTCEEWMAFAKEIDVPLIRMNHFSDLSEDEQAWENGFVENVEFANGKTRVMPRSPIHMESVTDLKTVPAKLLGADTEEVLAGLGYTAEQIKEMSDSGAVKLK